MPKTISAPINPKTLMDYAEEWYQELGWEVPPRGSEEWEKMYQEWSQLLDF